MLELYLTRSFYWLYIIIDLTVGNTNGIDPTPYFATNHRVRLIVHLTPRQPEHTKSPQNGVMKIGLKVVRIRAYYKNSGPQWTSRGRSEHSPVFFEIYLFIYHLILTN